MIRLFRLLLFLSSSMVFAWPSYQQKIPNGRSVPSPCPDVKPADLIWDAVGHKQKNQGGIVNPFGADFVDFAKFSWTHDLCMHDSDGDGVSNGVELGDPHCTWRPGETPEITDITKLSHPGFCEPKHHRQCWQDASFLQTCDILGQEITDPGDLGLIVTIPPELLANMANMSTANKISQWSAIPSQDVCNGTICKNLEMLSPPVFPPAPVLPTEVECESHQPHLDDEKHKLEKDSMILLIIAGIACIMLMLLATIYAILRLRNELFHVTQGEMGIPNKAFVAKVPSLNRVSRSTSITAIEERMLLMFNVDYPMKGYAMLRICDEEVRHCTLLEMNVQHETEV